MKRWTFRLALGLALGLTLCITAAVSAQGSPPETAANKECKDCHAGIVEAWEGSLHGQATTDTVFVTEWEKQDKPPDCLRCHTTGYNPLTGEYAAQGVTCEACHGAVSSDHPLSPAFMSRGSKECGTCHSDTYFEWKASRHGESDLTCVNCHGPHSTSLRAETTSELCADCHGTRVETFAHTSHSMEGLTCADCHITPTGEVGEGHGQRHHTFDVNLATCNKCHEADMHSPAGAMIVPADTPLPPDSMNSGHPGTVSEAPTPVSPVGYAIFAGLIGLAAGIVLAPWLEQGIHRFKSGPKNHRPVEVKS